MTVTHSTLAADPGLIGAAAWDANHVFSGGAVGSLLYRDTGQADGKTWLADVAVGSVLISGGVGAAPAWSATPRLTGIDFGSTVLLLDAANTLAQRNGATPQAFRLYESFTDASNYRRLNIQSTDPNTCDIFTSAGGTGGTGPMLGLGAGSARRWRIEQDGMWKAQVDNAYDLGAVGANRPRHGYFAGTLSFGTHAALAAETVTGYITITDAAGTTRKLAVVS